ncbi:MAG: hypothetical protein ACREXT_12280 [Gammaproteobacteria bacterium]
MTEFETAYLANELLNTATNLTTTYFSIASAFIVGAYVAAHRLSRTMVVIVVGLFVLWSFSLISQAGFVTSNYYRLVVRIRATTSEEMFAWYAPQVAPSWYVDSRPLTIWLSLIVVSIAAVVFFFHCRRINRKAETLASKSEVSS